MAGAAGGGAKYKAVLLGESGVGKSSLAQRLVRRQWVECLNSTLGASFFRYVAHVGDVAVPFDIWDTAGQERYRCLASMYYRGAAAALIVYDVTLPDTYQRAKEWVRELARVSPETLVALVGNKKDLESSRRVSAEEGRRYAAEADVLFAEVSAKNGAGIHEIFDCIARTLVETNSTMQVREGGVVGHTGMGEGTGAAPSRTSCC